MSTRYIGLNANNGSQISDLDHISQSIGKILLTPLGSRVMRRDFGSLIPDLIDKPLNGKTRMQLMAASVMAIYTWEPRVDLKTITLQQADETSGLYVDLEVSRRDGPTSGQASKLQIALKG